MDIKQPLLPSPPQLAVATLDKGLNLKINQLIEAKVIDTQIALDTLTLQVADKTLTVQAKQPLPLLTGQALQLQVLKLLPAVEFRIVPASPTQSQATLPLPGQTPGVQILKLLPQPLPAYANTATTDPLLDQLPKGQQLQAQVINIDNHKITLQLQTPPNTNAKMANSAAQDAPNRLVITLDMKQLLPATVTDTPKNTSTTTPFPAAQAAPTANLAIKEGTTINLQVVKPGQSPTFAVSTLAPLDEDIIVEAFKQLLPMQTTPSEVINQLRQLMPTAKNDATVSETLQHLAREILRTVPRKSQLIEPAQLQRAIARSGLFLESKLAEMLTGKADIALQDDLKLKLVKLVQLLNRELMTEAERYLKPQISKEILKELLQRAHGALARLTLDQLGSLPKDESPKQAWILELPFFDNASADSVYIEIEQDKTRDDGDRQKNWSVSITITPPDLGTIHCKISCYDGSINTRFWSETADTVEKINAHLDYLKQQLEQKGLTTGFMEAHQGKPAATDAVKKPPANLLSEKA